MILKLSMKHQRLKVYTVCINDDPELTMTYFTEVSNAWIQKIVLERGCGVLIIFQLLLLAVNKGDIWSPHCVRGHT